MARYAIKVEEILAKTIIVDNANSIEEAMNQVEEANITLVCEDYCCRNLRPSEYFHDNEIVGLVPDDANADYYEHI